MYLTHKIREKQVLCQNSFFFYSFVPILTIFFVYSHSQSGNRQRKNLKMNAKTISYGKDYCKKPNDKDANQGWC